MRLSRIFVVVVSCLLALMPQANSQTVTGSVTGTNPRSRMPPYRTTEPALFARYTMGAVSVPESAAVSSIVFWTRYCPGIRLTQTGPGSGPLAFSSRIALRAPSMVANGFRFVPGFASLP